MSASKYRSPSTGELCTAAQYIAEVICQRQSTKNKTGTLGYKFWNNPKWKKIYIGQVSAAAKLTKEFGDDACIRFINSSKGKWVLSLRAKKLPEEIRKFKEGLDIPVSPVIIENEPEVELVFSPRKTFGGKTLVSKLRNIDG